MRIVFFGTSLFAAYLLEQLINRSIPLVAIVTKPDKKQGRDLRVQAPPVKQTAEQIAPHLPILQPTKASTAEFVESLKRFSPDLFVVVAYGELLKSALLEMPRYGAINVHASLLPKYRGANPIRRCLFAGDKETGITIMQMVLEMDAGDILKMVHCPIPEEANFAYLEDKLSRLAIEPLIEVIEDIAKGSITKTPQDPRCVTFAPKFQSEELHINWESSADAIHNQVRALAPFPGAWCYVSIGGERKRFKILKGIVRSDLSGEPGAVLIRTEKEWVVGCRKGALQLLEVQLEGKKTLPASLFLRGAQKQEIYFV